MPRYALIALLPLGLAQLPAQAADADGHCNQMGREIALRAAELMDNGINAQDRVQLAEIAQGVCLEYLEEAMAMTPSGTAANTVASVERPRAESTTVAVSASGAAGDDAGQEALDGAGEDDADGGLFNLQIIDPEDRVKRPGLKRR